MRVNVFVAQATGLSRRKADELIRSGRIQIDKSTAELGDQVEEDSKVYLDGKLLNSASRALTIALNKPVGFVVSREGQGARTVYDLLPPELSKLKPIGRLDKDSSGLLLMTNDGQLAQELTHPRYMKLKTYEVSLETPLNPSDEERILKGVMLDDGLSQLELTNFSSDRKSMQVSMREGRNRQIRRTFASQGYKVIRLHRTNFGKYTINGLESGQYKSLI